MTPITILISTEVRDNEETLGEWEFSFDKKTVFNLFQDYPHKLSKEQKELFDRENPDWRDFFCRQKVVKSRRH